METALRINGHGYLGPYSRWLLLSGPATLADVLERLEIPAELQEAVVALKDRRFMRVSDPVAAGDVIHLFLPLCGG